MNTFLLFLKEYSDEDVKTSYAYHDILNPKIWNNEKIDMKVVATLKKIANDFVEFLKIPQGAVEDIILSGSSANYNWTEQSDIDLHVVINFNKVTGLSSDFVEEYLQAKRKIWNDKFKIKIKGMDVELYPQDSTETLVSGGIYSLKNLKWISKPIFKPPTINDKSVKHKAASVMNDIDHALKIGSLKSADRIRKKISNMRKAGLSSSQGEFSVENLVFKTLRNNGYIEKLMDFSTNAYDKKMSVE